MTLKTSLLITGDSKVAQAAVADLATEVGKLNAGATAAAAGAAQLDKAQTGAAGAARVAAEAQRDAAVATGALTAAEREAIAASGTLAGELRQMQAANAALRASLAQAVGNVDRLSAELREQGGALGQLRGDYAAALSSIDGFKSELAQARGEIDRLNASLAKSGGQLREHSKAANDNVRSAGQVKAGYYSLGQQMQDVGIQVSMGTDLLRVMAMQGGQLASAVDMIGVKGALGRFAAFLAGPWGAIVLTATAVLGPLIVDLFRSGDAAEDSRDKFAKAAQAADSYGTAQSILGKAIDLTTGKLKTQNKELIRAAELQARAMLVEGMRSEREARGEMRSFASTTRFGAIETSNSMLAAGLTVAGLAQTGTGSTAPAVTSLMRQLDAGKITVDQANARLDRLNATGKITGKVYEDAALIILKFGTALNDQDAARLAQGVIKGGPVPDALKPYGRPDKPKKPPSTEARDEFGRDTADFIASLTDRFSGAPPVIREIDKQVRQLDDRIEDLGRRKPDGFKELIASAEAAKITVRDGLIAEVAKAFEKPKTLADQAEVSLGQLGAVIADLEKRKPVDWEKSVAGAKAAQATIQEALNRPLDDYLRQQDEALRIQHLLNQGRIEDAEVLREQLRLERERGPLSEAQVAAIRASVQARREEAREAERVYRWQQLYLDTARDVRAVIQDATQAFVRGDLSEFLRTPGKLLEAYGGAKGDELFERLFGGAFAELEQALTENPVEKASRRMAGKMDDASAAVAQLARVADAAATSMATGEPISPDIVVTGQREAGKATSIDSLMQDALSKVGTSLADLFTSPDLAKKIGGAIGEAGATALKGAATGQQIAGVANSLGVKMDSTGAQIGGALGSVTGIPGGDIAGAILGGLVGGLFAPTKAGNAAIVDGDVSSRGTTKSMKAAATTLAGKVTEGVDRIAQALGGSLGSYSLSIGKYKDKYRVRDEAYGGKRLTFSGESAIGLHSFGDDEGAAITYAISNAIADGAVLGLSEAVQKALKSSTDLDKAIGDALKVQETEALIGGLGYELDKLFRDAEANAKERVRVARAYGLDVLAVEKANAEERSKLIEQTVSQSVGSLQQLLDDMRFGDMFEGDASQQRTQLLAEIADARADAQAGEEGAGDRLADLYRRLTETSRDAFGTAGSEYASDRALAQSGAAEIIKLENDRVRAAADAQAATTAAVNAGNRLQDETNDQLAQMNTRLNEIAARLAAGTAVVPTTTSVARTTALK